MKLGRNEPCHCGSGLKFKKCHGSFNGPTDEYLKHILQAHEVRDFQRRRQQGHGRPIISTRVGSALRIVFVGGREFTGGWRTFHEFLRSYLLDVLGREWLIAEAQKPSDAQHRLARLARLSDDHIRAHLSPGVDGFISVPRIGAMQAMQGLAYDLYAVEHFGLRETDPALYSHLLHRLKLDDQYDGARLEFRVAAQFLRAGFELQWLDESRRGAKRCEYIATFPETGRRFAVECKVRGTQAANPWDKLGRIETLISKALDKEAEDERLVFVELNAPGLKDGVVWNWGDFVRRKICRMELNPQFATRPPAIILVSNFPELYHEREEPPQGGVIVEGFRTSRFKNEQRVTLRQAIELRAADRELFGLMKSIREHAEIPASFDSDFIGTEHVPRLGTRLESDGVSGVVESACVTGGDDKMAVVVRTDSGTREIWTLPLTPLEVAAWKSCPETFTGELGGDGRPKNTPIEFYEAILPFHLKMSREHILANMSAWPDQERLRALPHEVLVSEYVEAHVNSLFAMKRDANGEK